MGAARVCTRDDERTSPTLDALCLRLRRMGTGWCAVSDRAGLRLAQCPPLLSAVAANNAASRRARRPESSRRECDLPLRAAPRIGSRPAVWTCCQPHGCDDEPRQPVDAPAAVDWFASLRGGIRDRIGCRIADAARVRSAAHATSAFTGCAI